jgi:Zn-dependent protease with chaperone function
MSRESSATDFFSWQDYARRQTTRLLVLFGLSVLAIILTLYLVAVIALGQVESDRQTSYHTKWPDSRPSVRQAAAVEYWNPALFASIALGTLTVVGLGSLYKVAELASGGETVAVMLGGRPIDPQTKDPAQRRLLNVVEEMSIASGVPVPPVFVLWDEPGINAFAAGYHPNDAVVAVSQGALTYLNREELQGVVAHEFSHILHGDMRLNLRLIGLISGILVLAIIGYYVLRSTGNSSRNDKKGGAGAIVLIGLAMYIVGYIGVFFGNLIKSAISRQREYLADASAVQFTRYPSGIAGALKKIGGLAEGSRIRDSHAEEVSHMFFGNALAGSFFQLFATHPPLVDRIRRLDPQFDGQFPEVEPVDPSADATPARPVSAAAVAAAQAPVAAMALNIAARLNDVARPQQDHLDYAGEVLRGLPQALVDAAREPFSARALVYALLLARDDQPTRDRQFALLESKVEPPSYRQTQQLAAALMSIDDRHRLPLADLTVPALRRLSPSQYQAFRQAVDALTKVDGKLDLFEYCLCTMLFGYLDVQFRLRPAPAVRYRSLKPLQGPLVTILSALAYAGSENVEKASLAFQAGIEGVAPDAVSLSAKECTFAAFDAALRELAQATSSVRKQVLAACMRCIAADGTTTLKESEMVRVVAAAISCPLPPSL